MIPNLIYDFYNFYKMKILVEMCQTSKALSYLERPCRFKSGLYYLGMLHFAGELQSCLRDWIEQWLNQSGKAEGGLVFGITIGKTILNKEGKGAIDFKVNRCVVVASTTLYYSSNIYVLLKYSREHRFDYSVAMETTNVCEIFTSVLFSRPCDIPSKWRS